MNGLQLAICDLALPPEGAAPNWVHLLPMGKMEGRDGRGYTLSDPQGLIAAFQASGIDLPVDYEHQSDKPEARINGLCLRRAGSRNFAPMIRAFGAASSGRRRRHR